MTSIGARLDPAHDDSGPDAGRQSSGAVDQIQAPQAGRISGGDG